MSRTLRAAILLLFLASCGGGNFSAPHHMDDACAVIQQRPHYLQAMKVTQAKWGVPISVQMAILYQESKFIGNARTTTSIPTTRSNAKSSAAGRRGLSERRDSKLKTDDWDMESGVAECSAECNCIAPADHG